MSTDAWENRFRDPAWVAIWQRWHTAMHAWEKAWWALRLREGGPRSVSDPDPRLITDPVIRAAAQEFQDARTAYRAEVASEKYKEDTP